jgi:hypothetical protein
LAGRDDFAPCSRLSISLLDSCPTHQLASGHHRQLVRSLPSTEVLYVLRYRYQRVIKRFMNRER